MGVALGLAAAVAAQDSAVNHVQAGMRLQQSGDCAAAIAEYTTALEMTEGGGPSWASVWTNLGVCEARQGALAKAVTSYQEALKLNPGFAAAQLDLGLAYYKDEQLESAAAAFQRYLANHPGDARTLVLEADCALRLGRNAQVIQLAAPLESRHDQAKDPTTWSDADRLALDYVLGTAYIRQGQMAEGEALIDRIMRRGDTAQAHMMMGEAYFQAHEFPRAKQELAQAVAMAPTLRGAHLRLAVAEMFSGDMDAALASLQAEYALDPNGYETNFYLGYLYKQRNELDRASEFLRRAEQLRPGSYEPNFQLAVIAYQRNDLPQAERRLQQAVQANPNAVDAHVILGRVYYRLHQVAEGQREQATVRRLNALTQAQSIRERVRASDTTTPLPAQVPR